MLELRNVSYRYAGYARPALSGVDLALGEGEIVGLVGPNEAGKSTLCLVASGLAPASIGGRLDGEVRIDGQPIAGRPTHELARLVGLVFQNPTTQRSGVTATVFEEVALGPVNLGLELADTVGQTWWAIRMLGIDALARRDPVTLSGGEAQLVAIASILAMRPPYLVLDEPTAQLDPEGARLVGRALRLLAGSGTSLLVAEQRTDLLDAICNRVVAIDGGRLVLDGPASSVLEDPRLGAIGVEPPARVRIGLVLAANGLSAPGPLR